MESLNSASAASEPVSLETLSTFRILEPSNPLTRRYISRSDTTATATQDNTAS